MRRVTTKEKVNNGLVRAALVAGVTSGVVAASLGVVGTATASCFSISGFGIGDGCVASFGSVAIVIGPSGTGASTATAGNVGPFSPFNLAISVGTADQDTHTSAGTTEAIPGVPSLGNVSFATAGSRAISTGIFNLASSVGGTNSTLIAAGVGNSALNLGSNNELQSLGVFNNTTNSFGDDNNLTAFSAPGTGLIPPLGFNVAFNAFGNNNQAVAGPGPGAIAGLIGVNNQNFLNRSAVTNSDFGIELRTPFNEVTPPASTSLAAGNANSFAPTTLTNGSSNKSGNQLSGSTTKGGKQLGSSLKKLNDGVKKALGGSGKKKQSNEAKNTHPED